MFAVAALMALGFCASVLPDTGDFGPLRGGEPVGPVEGPGKDDRLKLVRSGTDPALPAAWSTYRASDGTFGAVGPNAFEREERGRTIAFVFEPVGPIADLVLEVRALRGSSSTRPALERVTAIFLDDLAAVEVARTWTTAGDGTELEVDARRGDRAYTIRTLAGHRRLYRIWASYPVRVGEDRLLPVRLFLDGLTVPPPP